VRPRDRRYQTNPKMRAVTPLPELRKRVNVRVIIPPTITLYARIRNSVRATASYRAVVNDLSAAGMSLTVIEGGRYEMAHAGQDIVVDLDFEGAEARVAGRVVRVGAQQLSMSYPSEHEDDKVNHELLGLMARVVTRRIDFIDGRRFASHLAARLVHRHFTSAGYMDLRVQVESPSWWQLVFLEYVISWSDLDGLETGIIDRSLGDRPGDALSVRGNLSRHPAPWRSLLRITNVIAGQCLAALPVHADCFQLVQRTVAPALV
jgi:hypothetical protein